MRTPPLEYARKTKIPWLRRRHIQRRFIGVAVLMGLLGATWLALSAWRQLHTNLVLRRCMKFTAPDDRICFDGDPATSSTLVTTGGEYRNELDHEARSISPVAAWAPPQWVDLIRCVDPTLATFRFSPPLVFMHERKSPDGFRRLVLLRYVGNVTSEGGPTNHVFDFDLIDPSSWPAVKSIRTFQTTVLSMSHPFSRLYFGQPDAADSAHFQFRYQTEEGAGTLDGWLRNDHELSLECRDGPEKGR